MDPWAVVAVLLLLVVVALAVLLGRAQRTLNGARRALGDPGTDGVDAVAGRVRRELDQQIAATRAAVEDRDAAFAALEAGIVGLDATGHVTVANPAAHALLGRPAGSLAGRTLMETFLDPAVEALVRAIPPSGRDAAGPGSVETTPAGADGTVLLVHAHAGTAGGAWLVLVDVSELRRLQRIRAEFIDNLSHELRTPITTVSLLAETLSREAAAAGDAVPARMRERIAKIEVETGHLVQMVSELMDLSRIESGGPLELVDGLDLGRIAAESAERLHLFAERHGVTLRIEGSGDLPVVRGDAARLGQVVVNLVHNAVKFSPEGGDVIVRTEARDGSVVVSVEDHGIGIPRAAQDRVFERFYKVDRARSRGGAGGGTGLGLAIARHVIEQHGGRISVVSTEGRGSTFSFAIPAATSGR